MPKIPGVKWRAQYSGLSCACNLDIDKSGSVTLYYPRNTKLGGRIAQGWTEGNDNPVRAVLANYIRQEFGLPRGEANAARVSFVGV